jgi:NADPH:quinone reductase-like Zn-dependent oxidoreductase
MKAIVVTRYGSPDVLQLQKVEKPVPKDHEVLIRIYASSVSSGDSRIRRADPFMVRLVYGFLRPKASILGNEFAGVVEAVGKDVSMFQPGDEVFGAAGFSLGTNAEYISLPENGAITHKPVNISFAQAAAIPFGATAALYFLRNKANIQPGQKILINGASGSLGTAAVQLAKHFGAHVTAVNSKANAQLVRSLGADEVVDYTHEDFTQNGETYDFIFDTIGKLSFSKSKASLKANGLFLAAAGGLSTFFQAFRTSLHGGKKVVAGVVQGLQADLNFLRELIEAGRMRAVIDRTYPLEQTAEAHRYVDKGHKKGNVVIHVADAEQLEVRA